VTGSVYLPSLIEHCDAVDLDIDARSVRYAAGTSSRHFLSGHVFAKGFIPGMSRSLLK
jgi:hypothetical protein